MARTLFEKVWDNHVVTELEGGGVLLYIDRHLIHEVTSPQAFDGLREAGRPVRRPDLTFATVDHNVPTDGRPIDPSTLSGQQLEAMRRNCEEFGVKLYGYGDRGQGIVHVIGPQMGITLPGLTIVCGDSHTSTHGAFGALAFGIGTTEVEHVLATQTLRSPKQPKTLAVNARGQLGYGVTAKDLILYIIRTLGAGGGTGHVVEYRGEAVRSLSMQGRMTMANMSIEMGARAGMIAPDDTTFEFIAAVDRPFAPKGADLERMIAEWRQLATDEGATFDREIEIDASALVPQVTWGTTPAMTVDVTGSIPEPKDASEKRAQMYMGVSPGQSIEELTVNTVFLGSCTNSRIEDLRAAAQVMRGHQVASGVRALVVPGSEEVRIQAESEGLDQIFKDSGWEWHRAGCSMCLGMNGDIVRPGERSASTSNRPYEGRQGPGSRTHLVSPISAAAAAIRGHLADPRPFLPA
ncbi:MAG TPA: 3-isopropylmalate dehydratase large subunit [Fimbriimonadaceae bacterium]|nr:3-isopropylmalate dehydratase large subunit [Armatimonadota bacterium]HCM74255.1 3-isopropylmalate dehydratase large subunit [Armatimonadota bacterium]HRI73896.1 3-isopropylmalate dehydratase large subunit [Fimbriimonadaceae bacterium]